MKTSRLILFGLLAAASACDPIVLGDLPATEASGDESSPPPPEPVTTLVWSTSHESGDAVDWDEGGLSEGGQYVWGTGSIRGTTSMSRSGSHALELTIDTTGAAPSDGARLYRRIRPVPARYGAWFYLERAHRVGEWWAPVIFHARDDSLSVDVKLQLWDLRIISGAAGEMTLEFFDHATLQSTPITAAVVPVRLWFHIEVHLDYRPPDATSVRVYLNGALVFDRQNLETTVEEHVFWVVGNAGASLDPSSSLIYLDDASVTIVEEQP